MPIIGSGVVSSVGVLTALSSQRPFELLMAPTGAPQIAYLQPLNSPVTTLPVGIYPPFLAGLQPKPITNFEVTVVS